MFWGVSYESAAGATKVRIVNNFCIGIGTFCSSAADTFRNSMTSNALLVNEPGSDYHLTANSPGINAAINPGIGDSFNLTPGYS